MTAFWDASAIVPICVPIQDGGRGRRLLREHSPVVWWGTALEVWSALLRLSLSPPQKQAARERLSRLERAWREIQPTDRLRDLAQAQLERHAMRAGDALQLAAAMVWCQQRPKARTFLCRDRRLREAAREAGFSVIEF